MKPAMQPFIVNAMRTITQSLQSASIAESSARSPVDVVESPDARAKPTSEYRLNCLAAEPLKGGSWAFPDAGSAADWCVLHLTARDRARGLSIFKLRGRLRATFKAEEFVRLAYRHILMRKIDDDGLRTYPPIIDQDPLMRREVLRILAESDEAAALHVQVILIPYPSPWLSPLEIPGANDDTEFPALCVTSANP